MRNCWGRQLQFSWEIRTAETVHLENEIIKHPPPDEIVKRLKYKMSESSKTFKADFKQEVDDKESIPTSHLSMYARAMLIVENDYSI